MEPHASNLLFVYGTLMKGMDNPFSSQMAQGSEWVGRASVHGQLFDYHNEYPCAVVSPQTKDRIYGELYRLKDPKALFPLLDEWEDCHISDHSRSLFIRCVVPVRLDSNQVFHAWMYFWNNPLSGLTSIESGDYRLR